ncbi:carboxypeptidase-like regulatory domain-containing protein [Hymenobacter aerilatus]|uniref:Carboxypeptidase-like regulatory domain-containing protein n=1 Tax=Hymenobacter aerilatus TaxID=2932251 RepID=A0A8T9T2V4_9BACT|nr:carboxypeptidase-like regulatory domain-containing protein [Hymenobacter aerilatus]UOR07504.1 carboxypeptidase-like regulatory domain-containing protein [Hymenobacter aerilatus]
MRSCLHSIYRPACFIFFLLLLLGSIGATSALAQTSPTAALPRTLTGKVTTIAGAPLAGATVLVRGDQRDNTAITNKEGMFLLTTRQAQPVLIVNCAGYEENQADVPQTGDAVVSLAPIDKYKRQLRKQGKKAYKEWNGKGKSH